MARLICIYIYLISTARESLRLLYIRVMVIASLRNSMFLDKHSD